MIPRTPAPDCTLCPRLAAFRRTAVTDQPAWHNAPVPAFGSLDARLLVVGLAPGLRGANRTGRPFTGDFAGELLYGTLIDLGFARGRYEAHAGDGLTLVDCRITNAVRCVPPDNKPTTAEMSTCRPFLADELAAMPARRITLALGRIAHDAVVRTTGGRPSALPFQHGARHALADGTVLFDSYHCSRYNQNTRRLTPGMFRDVVAACAAAVRAHDGSGST